MYLLADTFSRIRVASMRHSSEVVLLNSKYSLRCVELVCNLGYSLGVKILSIKYSKLYLKSFLGASAIRSLNVISKKNSKIYLKLQLLHLIIYKNKFLSNGFLICSTSYKNKLYTDIECLLLRKSGEASFYVS